MPEVSSLTEATHAAEPALNTQPSPAKPETVAKTEATDEFQPALTKREPADDGQCDKGLKMETDANANTETGVETKMETNKTNSETKSAGAEDEPKNGAEPELEKESGMPAAAAAQREADGYQFLISTLKEDILSIEEELSAGWLGAVPEPADWADRVLSAETADQLGAAVLECERHVRREVLQGPLAPARGQAEGQSTGGQRWTDAVGACRTLSRLHVLVGLLDSAIRWDLSTAQKVSHRGPSGRHQSHLIPSSVNQLHSIGD